MCKQKQEKYISNVFLFCSKTRKVSIVLLQVVGKEYMDAKVVEAHIVPGQLLLTSLIPTQEVATVAWDKSGVQVNVSLQPSYAQEGSVMVR